MTVKKTAIKEGLFTVGEKTDGLHFRFNSKTSSDWTKECLERFGPMIRSAMRHPDILEVLVEGDLNGARSREQQEEKPKYDLKEGNFRKLKEDLNCIKNDLEQREKEISEDRLEEIRNKPQDTESDIRDHLKWYEEKLIGDLERNQEKDDLYRDVSLAVIEAKIRENLKLNEEELRDKKKLEERLIQLKTGVRLPRPSGSLHSLVALAILNSQHGFMSVDEIYSFLR